MESSEGGNSVSAICLDVEETHSSPRLITLQDVEVPADVIILPVQILNVVHQLHLTNVVGGKCQVEDVRDKVWRSCT